MQLEDIELVHSLIENRKNTITFLNQMDYITQCTWPGYTHIRFIKGGSLVELTDVSSEFLTKIADTVKLMCVDEIARIDEKLKTL